MNSGEGAPHHRQWAEFAPAKVNLCLHVLARRDDGLHDLQSLVVFPEFGDDLALAPSRAMALALHGDSPTGAGLALDESNLVLRAARALAPVPDDAVAFCLRKRIPVGAGLGGGSADAAAALRLHARYLGRAIDPESLVALAAELGADVPVCLGSRPSWVEGVGERVTVLALPKLWLVMVWPGKPIATGAAFARLAESGARPAESLLPPDGFATLAELVDWLGGTRNDLEVVADTLVPACRKARDALWAAGALHATMTGSGSAQVGIFASAEEAERAAGAIRWRRPEWWVVAAAVMPGDYPGRLVRDVAKSDKA